MTLTTSARAGFAGTAALVALALGSTGTAQAATAPDVAAASYLAQQLAANGNRLTTTFSGETYDDYGSTIDAVLALAAAGTAQTQLARSTAYMTANGANYYGSGGESYAGATAKQAVMVQATGGNSSALITALQKLLTASGRYSDKTQWDDYSGAISQSWAIIALKRAGVAVPDKAVSFLLSQQCTDGGFRVKVDTTPCVSDPDATSFAAQALSASGNTAALSKAANYLATKQVSSGGVVGGSGATGANSNSTGLAAVAFSLAGKTANASRATAYVKSLQFGCTAPAALRGAIAYDKTSFDQQVSAGATPAQVQQNNRSTVQGILALTKQPYLTISAHGSAATTPVDCSTTTQSPTSSPSSSSASSASSSSTSSASSTSTVTGPPVITDGGTGGQGADLGLLAGVGAVIASIGAGAAAYGRRRR